MQSCVIDSRALKTKSLKNRGMKLAPGLSSDWLKLETANIPEVLKNLKVCAVYVVAIF